uniref:Uncharacterized protein n=1 Tax=Anguilla anguilla TaxID=7936 RepID=A0A0E9V275_ANGAN
MYMKVAQRNMCSMKEGDLSDKDDPRLGVPCRVVIVGPGIEKIV